MVVADARMLGVRMLVARMLVSSALRAQAVVTRVAPAAEAKAIGDTVRKKLQVVRRSVGGTPKSAPVAMKPVAYVDVQNLVAGRHRTTARNGLAMMSVLDLATAPADSTSAPVMIRV